MQMSLRGMSRISAWYKRPWTGPWHMQLNKAVDLIAFESLEWNLGGKKHSPKKMSSSHLCEFMWIYGIYVSWDWGVLFPFYCRRWWYPQLLVHCIGISADPIQWRLIVCHNEKGNGKQGNMDVSLMDKILCREWDDIHPEYAQKQTLSRSSYRSPFWGFLMVAGSLTTLC